MIWLCFILQTSVFKMLDIITIAPNLLLIMTTSIAFMQGRKEGMTVGFVCGLFYDLTYGYLLGTHSIILVVIGYACGSFRNIFGDEDIKVPLLLVAAGEIFYNIVIYIFGFLLQGRTQFVSYFKTIILPETVWTVLITIVLYRLIYRINHRMVEKEKEGNQSLWIRD